MNTLNVKEKWERESTLNIKKSGKNYVSRNGKHQSSPQWRVLFKKPHKVRSNHHRKSSICWRQRGSFESTTITYFGIHIFWNWPSVTYWLKVHKVMQKVSEAIYINIS